MPFIPTVVVGQQSREPDVQDRGVHIRLGPFAYVPATKPSLRLVTTQIDRLGLDVPNIPPPNLVLGGKPSAAVTPPSPRSITPYFHQENVVTPSVVQPYLWGGKPSGFVTPPNPRPMTIPPRLIMPETEYLSSGKAIFPLPVYNVLAPVAGPYYQKVMLALAEDRLSTLPSNISVLCSGLPIKLPPATPVVMVSYETSYRVPNQGGTSEQILGGRPTGSVTPPSVRSVISAKGPDTGDLEYSYPTLAPFLAAPGRVPPVVKIVVGMPTEREVVSSPLPLIPSRVHSVTRPIPQQSIYVVNSLVPDTVEVIQPIQSVPIPQVGKFAPRLLSVPTPTPDIVQIVQPASVARGGPGPSAGPRSINAYAQAVVESADLYTVTSTYLSRTGPRGDRLSPITRITPPRLDDPYLEKGYLYIAPTRLPPFGSANLSRIIVPSTTRDLDSHLLQGSARVSVSYVSAFPLSHPSTILDPNMYVRIVSISGSAGG